MLAWFKRSDGFRWKKYVQTQVLARRAQRRERMQLVAQSAANGVKAAGGLAAEGVGRAAVAVAPLARPINDALSRPSVSGPFLWVGILALVASGVRLYGVGRIDREAGLALGLGIVLLLVSFGPRWLNGSGPRVPATRLAGLAQSALAMAKRRELAVALAVAGVLAVGLFFWGRGAATSLLANLPSLPAFAAKPIEGRALPVTADLIRIDAKVLRLAGIEAPEREQRCQREGGKSWACGRSAEAATAKLIRGRALVCDVLGTDEAQRPTVQCRDGSVDINATLVREGHVFATRGMFAPYAAAEQEARSQKAGIWRGEAERPADWRGKLWEDAKKRSPEGCPIKGHVTSAGKQYVVPWAPDYGRRPIQKSRGDRWFCSEQDAISAGFKASDRGAS